MTSKLRTHPWWTPDAVLFVNKLLTEQSKVLEFGSGGSTVWLYRRTKQLISVEHEPKWHALVKEAAPALDIRLRSRPYDQICAEFPDNHFDLVIVDGRDRVLCFLAALRLVKPGGWILLDDAKRERYRQAWESVEGWTKVQTSNPNLPEQRTGSRVTWLWQKPK